MAIPLTIFDLFSKNARSPKRNDAMCILLKNKMKTNSDIALIITM
ncbi:hypothetical protein SF293071_1066 [Shigella flexneri 2930-71]|nr:hypothetical protein SF293071_1066 [Shigella flexneri 2930-71]